MSIEPQERNWVSAAPVVSWAPFVARQVLNGPTMGTRYSAIFNAPVDNDLGAVSAALQLAVDTVDAQMSNWRPASDVSRFNAAESGAWVQVAADVLKVVETGMEIGRRTQGVFDIGVGPLVDAWGFGPVSGEPDPAAIAALRSCRPSAQGMLKLDRRTLRMRTTGPLQLDLCGIAKGFGVDQLARVLELHGIDNYLVSIDGELRGRGCRLDGSPWHVAIERPDQSNRGAAAIIALQDRAIATSGDYRHWHRHDGRIVSHTMDPRTGAPVQNALASVSVLAANCMMADAWATALLVAGEHVGPQLAEANGLDALFVLRHGDELIELPIGKFN